jgi:hypothetical protein
VPAAGCPVPTACVAQGRSNSRIEACWQGRYVGSAGSARCSASVCILLQPGAQCSRRGKLGVMYTVASNLVRALEKQHPPDQ